MLYKKNIFCKHPQRAKKIHSKSEKLDFLQFFPIFTEGIKAKLTELESESESFMPKVKIYHYHLPITI